MIDLAVANGRSHLSFSGPPGHAPAAAPYLPQPPMNRHPLALAALLAASLCAAPLAAQTDTTTRGTPPTAETPAVRVVRARRDLNSINYEEFRTGHYADAYELIHHLRPSWLRTPRGNT